MTRISHLCVGGALFSVCIAGLFYYYAPVGAGVFRRPPAVAVLTNAEMLATFGDGDCTSCMQTAPCISGYVVGTNCVKCSGMSAGDRDVCCPATDNLATGTTCAYTGELACQNLDRYQGLIYGGVGSCASCTSTTYGRVGDCDGVVDAVGQMCNRCGTM